MQSVPEGGSSIGRGLLVEEEAVWVTVGRPRRGFCG